MSTAANSTVTLKSIEGALPTWMARPVVAGVVPVVRSMVQWINLTVTDLDTELELIQLAYPPECAMLDRLVFGDPSWPSSGGYTFKHRVDLDHLNLPMRAQYDYTLNLQPSMRNGLGSLRLPMRFIHHQVPAWSR